ncbi:MAG: hypothetical protein M1817_006075 [Caeruleum heppii]|nr:MAG: hypothetical protein M1817_006075 [Caeruleum heppii]
MLSVALLLIIIAAVDALPSITFPINSQLPPVARVSQPFRFTFSESTFSSSGSSLTYQLSAAPTWLQLDGASRTLLGTPSQADVGNPQVSLTATDSEGSVSMDVTVAVTSDPGVEVKKPLSDQLPALGNVSSPNSLSMYASAPFDFSLAPDTFSGGTYRYAVSSDNSPLPSWVNFDQTALRFSGTTPQWTSLIAPPQHFGLKVIASDVMGFSEAVAEFEIVVGSHELSFDFLERTVNATKGRLVNVTGLRDALKLDGVPLKEGELQSVSINIPGWTSFDRTTFSVAGTPPRAGTIERAVITATDVYGDVANVSIIFQVQSAIFSQKLGVLNATLGEDFTYTLDRSVFIDPDVDVTSESNPGAPWMSFDPAALKWEGRIPEDLGPVAINIRINATSRQTGVSEVQSFQIQLEEGDASSADPTPTDSAVAGGSATSRPPSSTRPAAAEVGQSARTGPSRTTIAIAVCVPIVSLVAALLILFCCMRWRHARNKRRPASPLRRDISRPILPVEEAHEEPEEVQELEKEPEKEQEPAPKLPRLGSINDLWRSSMSMRRSQSNAARSYEEDDDRVGVAKSHGRRSLIRSPIEGFTTARLSTNFSRTTMATAPPPIPQKSPSRRYSSSRRLSRLSSPSSMFGPGPSLHRRVSGVGHGSGRMGPPGYGIPRRSLREFYTRSTWETVSDLSLRTESTAVLDHFPQPPHATVRMVKKSPDPTRLSASRAERYGPRRAGHSPFLTGSSRASSQSRTRARRRRVPDVPLPDDDSNTLPTIESYLRELTPENSSDLGSPMSSRRAFESGLSRFRTFGSRISDSLDHLSRQTSNLSSRFQSASSDVPSDGVPDDGRFVEMIDEDGQRRWYQADSPTLEEEMSASRPSPSRHSTGELEERYNGDQSIEHAVPMTMSRAQQPRGLQIERPRASRNPSSRHSARLVDFAPSRPASVDFEGHKRLTSRSASLAFV